MRNKNVSIILTILSGVGFVATCVAVAKATPKAMENVQTATEKKGNNLTKAETIKAAAPAYIPSAVMGISSLACMAGSTILDKKTQASLSSAIAVGSNYVQKYKEKVSELFGEETVKQIEDEIEEPEDKVFFTESWLQECFNQSEDNPGTPMLFYDLSSGTYFEKTLEQVLLAEYHLNRNYILSGEATLNDWYHNLGLDEHMDEIYDNIVWSPMDDGDYWIDFNHKKKIRDDGREYYEIEIITEPYHLDEMP